MEPASCSWLAWRGLLHPAWPRCAGPAHPHRRQFRGHHSPGPSACLLARASLHIEPRGLLLGLLSGALASGIGYVLWYRALAGLSKLSAGIVQLAVPVLAAAGGIAFLGERATLRFLLASLLVLGGVALGLAADDGIRLARS